MRWIAISRSLLPSGSDRTEIAPRPVGAKDRYRVESPSLVELHLTVSKVYHRERDGGWWLCSEVLVDNVGLPGRSSGRVCV